MLSNKIWVSLITFFIVTVYIICHLIYSWIYHIFHLIYILIWIYYSHNTHREKLFFQNSLSSLYLGQFCFLISWLFWLIYFYVICTLLFLFLTVLFFFLYWDYLCFCCMSNCYYSLLSTNFSTIIYSLFKYLILTILG